MRLDAVLRRLDGESLRALASLLVTAAGGAELPTVGWPTTPRFTSPRARGTPLLSLMREFNAMSPCEAPPGAGGAGRVPARTHQPRTTTISPRLLSPEQAAQYLSLGSKWAVRRLAATGAFPTVRVLGKLRYDQGDLDAFIEAMKSSPGEGPRPAAAGRVLTRVPRRLAPRARRRRVTTVVTAPDGRP